MILLGVILVPGLLQAKTPARGWVHVDSRPASESGFFNMVWSLLTDIFERGTGLGSGSSFSAKDGNGGYNGGMLDPNG
jgi:hypothetical protein